MTYVLRPYQARAVEEAVRFLRGPARHNAIEVLPTGSGKSLVIANIVQALGHPTLVFQPTKEILEQNYDKYRSNGFDAGIYSASVGRKQIYPVTFATIGSIKTRPDLFSIFPYVIVDECHFVNSKGGMYRDFFRALAGTKILGLTATPYRLTTDGFGGSILKFLTRTRPRVFTELIYYVQNGDLFRQGYLAPLVYRSTDGFDRSMIKVNTTGADYDDASLRRYYREMNFQEKVLQTTASTLISRRNALIFTRYIEEAEYVASRIPDAAIVTSLTPKRERERILAGFKNGAIRAVCNVGVLTTGFDYPELETIIMARPTMSLALYYQMIGRSIRIHPGKEYSLVVDMCGNTRTFGKVEDLQIVDGGNGKWFISNQGKQLTNVYYGRRRN